MCNKGGIYIDKEQYSKIIVARLISEPCDEVVCKDSLSSEQTVYDCNSHHPYVSRDDPVVVGVYANSIQELLYKQDNFKDIEDEVTRKGRRILTQDAIGKSHVKPYYFPITRIVPTNE